MTRKKDSTIVGAGALVCTGYDDPEASSLFADSDVTTTCLSESLWPSGSPHGTVTRSLNLAARTPPVGWGTDRLTTGKFKLSDVQFVEPTSMKYVPADTAPAVRTVNFKFSTSDTMMIQADMVTLMVMMAQARSA